MRKLKLGALAILPFLMGAGDSNWKWFALSPGKIGGELLESFFDINSVKHTANGHVQVWTKSLSDKEMNDSKLGVAGIGQAAGRLAHYYVPLAARTDSMNKTQIINIVIAEAYANEGVLVPKMEELFEVNCKDETLRTLSVHTDDNHDTENPTVWEHIAPETNGWRLMKLVC